MNLNPSNVVPVEDFSSETLQNIIDHIEVSDQFEHFVYRESELDAVCRLVEMAIKEEQRRGANPEQIERLERIMRAAREAHDSVADEKPKEAVWWLKQVL